MRCRLTGDFHRRQRVVRNIDVPHERGQRGLQLLDRIVA